MSTETTPGDDFTKVATVDDVPKGSGIGVEVDGIEIAIFNADGKFFAIANRCAHQQAPMCKAGDKKINADHTWTESRGGLNEEACTVSCPWHLWEWDLKTGEHEASGKRIGTFDVTVSDGGVYVRI